MSETVSGVTFIIVGLLMVAILLKVLAIVHKQSQRVRDLEARMKTFESIEESAITKEEQNG